MRKIVFWLLAAALLIRAACRQGDKDESLPLEACEAPCGFRDSLGFHSACEYEGDDCRAFSSSSSAVLAGT
jgi:hypothetical protein